MMETTFPASSDSSFWVIRSGQPSGRYALDFVKNGWAGVAWLPDLEVSGLDAPSLYDALQREHPDSKHRTLQSWAAQLHRFVSGIEIGHPIVVYIPSERRYALGIVLSDVTSSNRFALPQTRKVRWSHYANKDQLSPQAQRSLSSGLTLFGLPSTHAQELVSNSFPISVSRAGRNDKEFIAEANPAKSLYDLMDFLRRRADSSSLFDALSERYGTDDESTVWRRYLDEGPSLFLETEKAVERTLGEDPDYLAWRDDLLKWFSRTSLWIDLSELPSYVSNETMLHLRYCAKAMSEKVDGDDVARLLGMIQEFRAKAAALELDASVAAYVERRLQDMERIVVGHMYGTTDLSELARVAISIAETLRSRSYPEEEASCLTELMSLVGTVYETVKTPALRLLTEQLPQLLPP